MKRILVTGGAGFIGTHTCYVLLNKGYKLIVLDSFVNSSPSALEAVINLINIENPSLIPDIKIIKGDIRDNILLNQIFANSKKEGFPIQAVIHFAGLKSVSESIIRPLDYWDVNVSGSINLFRAMSVHNCKTIVFSSSATIYSKSSKTPFIETSPITPENPYGFTKTSVEQILRNLFESSFSKEWKVINLRYFNPVGAHPSGDIGEDPINTPNNLFPYVSQVAVGKLKFLNIYGDDWPTPDGTGIRDYIHIMDLAEAHSSSLDLLLNNEPKFLDLNIGTGKGTSVFELVNIFESTNNCKVPYRVVNRRQGDIPISIANNQLALTSLNWFPVRSLEDMCRDGFHWQTKNPSGFNKP